MSDSSRVKAPVWFWVVAVLALLWNLMGLAAYVMQVNMSPEALAALPEAHQALYAALPAWVTGAFAVAVHAGTLGSLALVLRQGWAIPVLLLSLIGVLAQNCYMFFLSDTFQVLGSNAMLMPFLVIVIALFLVWFARMSKTKGWIG